MSKRYGPSRTAEDKRLCAKTLRDDYSEILYQCPKKRGHGLGEEFCRSHAGGK